ncbi:hypothetical protein HJG60_010301 [Phyllostomus discolor]|uniref:Uncharacterized protein n=1 Tax=Phyllostomus discolor TaxID=89673 RepID=A0A834ASJ9_9CHIR|nr:hypothetical protein HJG60_010301 [Phyllostomus discolor]
MFLSLSFLPSLSQGCQTHFHWGPQQPHGCLQRAECNFRLYKCNYPLTRGQGARHCRRVETRCRDGGPDSAFGPCVCHLCSKINQWIKRSTLQKLEKLVLLICCENTDFNKMFSANMFLANPFSQMHTQRIMKLMLE